VDLKQEQIQAWIERIPWHIEQIIAYGGGNEYKEGRKKQVTGDTGGDWVDQGIM